MYANAKMVAEIQKYVKISPSVAKALGSVDRAFFVPPSLKNKAYSLDPLPLEDSQWISSPLTVAIMSESLLPDGGESVLEVGCGSGYQAMVLSHLFKYVYTIERIEPLIIEAKRRFHLLNAHNIFAKLDDGQNGWIQNAPFDAVIFSACAREIPSPLVAQLKEGGILLAPMFDKYNATQQHITRFVKQNGVLGAPLVITQCSFVDVCDGIVSSRSNGV
ncbi:MAG TPA: protein-L-isoaspartate(D-aspartate) O-methyltransferase [Candidatus Helicobacter avicola]|nr:protein-L-isoaspartate(D-aspartate) O-methyltransferase [Candidatus Helicobacter avicola]